MGTPEYAQVILAALIAHEGIEVVAVFTQPDRPIGRKALLTPPPVKLLAQAHGIPIYQPERLREAVDECLAIACDRIIVAAYGQILPRAILDHAPCINLHASLLPRYRGASPIQQSLLNNDSHTGITAMWMDEGLDTGALIEHMMCTIAPDETLESLYGRLSTIAAQLTLRVIDHWDGVSATAQVDAEATHCRKITKQEGLVRLDNARYVYDHYRALTPWPGIYLESGLKIKSMTLEEENSSGDAGLILSITPEKIIVQCAQGTVAIMELQAPSKPAVRAYDYLNGKRLGCGDYLV